MTLPASAGRIVASGNGVTTGWPYNFLIPAESDLVVTITEVATAISTTLLASQYSVTGINNPAGGTVTYPLIGSPLPVGWTITIQRIVPYEQDTDLTNQDGFYADVIENALDYLTMQTQQLADDVSRALVEDPYGAGTVDAFSNRIINLANGTAAQDAVTFSQLQATVVAAGNVPTPGAGNVGKWLQALTSTTWGWVSLAIGTADIVDGAVTLAKEAPRPYASVASAATVNLVAQTVENVNITGTTNITSFGTGTVGRVYTLKFAAALTIVNSANIICLGGVDFVTQAGDVVQVYCSGSNVWEFRFVQRFAGGPVIPRLVTIYSSGSGNHTWKKWTRRARVRVRGGGAAGNTCAATAAGEGSAGGGGGAGGYVEHEFSFTSDQSGTPVAYGVGASVTSGNNGNDSTFGTLTGAGGGVGGTGNNGSSGQCAAGGIGGLGSGGNILNLRGGNGQPGIRNASQGWGGAGGGEGGAGGQINGGAGNTATANTGGGGAGASRGPSAGASNGGDGASGIIIVEEFAG